MDSFTECATRQKIHSFFLVKKEVPTIKKLLAALKEDEVIDCSWQYLRTLVIKLGFQWQRCQSKRKLIIERPEITAWRMQYLQAIRKYRAEGWNVVYLDETYIQEGHSVAKCWQSGEEVGVLQNIGKGKGLIIVHAGGEQGLVDGAALIFKAGIKSGDYHESMNFNNFCQWLKELLLIILESPSIIVMDNASYRSVQKDKKPTTINLKVDIQKWLDEHNLAYDQSWTKARLLQEVNNFRHEKIFVVDLNKIVLNN